METFVIGHKNPDTDAICSAIAYADLLNRTTMPGAVAARCGELNLRTEYVLQRANIPAPRLLMDVRLRARDVCKTSIETASPQESFLSVFNRMRKHNLRTIPVVDGKHQILGLLSFTKMLDLLLPTNQEGLESRLVKSSLGLMCRSMRGSFQNEVQINEDEDLIVVIGAMSTQTFTERIQRYQPEKTILITGDRQTIQAAAIERGVRCLVLTNGCQLNKDLLEKAKEKNVCVLLSPVDTASTTMLIRCSRGVGQALYEEYESFPETALVEEMRDALSESRQIVYPVVDASGCLKGVFSKSDLIAPSFKRVVMVDHNEYDQAVTGIEQAEVVEVIDHHRLGGDINTREPIRFINDPLGSTCTLVARMYQQQNLSPGKGIATCMAAGIISDTLFLTSPTTTQVDKEILKWLGEVAELDLEEFAESFFGTGSALSSLTPEEVVDGDCKKYEEHGWKVAVAQVEELGLQRFWNRKDELQKALQKFIEHEGLDFGALLITDITMHYSLLLVAGEDRINQAVDYPRMESHLFELDGIVSRKKQLLPALIRTLSGVSK